MKTIISIILVIISTSVLSQNLSVYKVTNNGEKPRLQWYTAGADQEAQKFTVWRAKINGDAFENIQTLAYINDHLQDTLIYTVKDTTLKEKGIYRYYIKFQSEEALQKPSPIVYGHNMGYIQAPMVLSMDVVSSKERKAIDISWQLNHHFSVRNLALFRSSYYNKDFVKIADLAGDATMYSDLVPLSNHNYFYFILISDFFGYQQPSVPSPGFCSFDKKPFPPQNIKLQKQNDDILLHWNNIETNLSGYQIYRSFNDHSFRPLHIMQTTNEQELIFIDSTAKQVSTNTTIHYYVVNYSDSYTKSNTSDTVSILIKKAEKPLPPNQLNVITQEDDRVKLIWDLSHNTDQLGYNIYRTKPEMKKLNDDIIPRKTNFFVDSTINVSGLHSYTIEAVGPENIVSEYKTSASINILSPYFHLVVDMFRVNDTVSLQWKALNTNRIKKIYLYRQENENIPTLLMEFENIDRLYKDYQLAVDKSYFYFFYGELSNGEKVLLNDEISINL